MFFGCFFAHFFHWRSCSLQDSSGFQLVLSHSVWSLTVPCRQRSTFLETYTIYIITELQFVPRYIFGIYLILVVLLVDRSFFLCLLSSPIDSPMISPLTRNSPHGMNSWFATNPWRSKKTMPWWLCWMTKQNVVSSNMADTPLSFGSPGIGCKTPIGERIDVYHLD